MTQITPYSCLRSASFTSGHKRHHSDTVVSALQRFKFKHFGHDIVVLHEHEIRKEKGNFNIFRGAAEREAFQAELGDLIDQTSFVLISCVIEKRALVAQGSVGASNPYHLALRAGLERLMNFLQEKRQDRRLTHIVFERRGKKEDQELELEFRRICDGDNALRRELPLAIKFADKRVNSAGLQLSDLVARPIGLHVLRSDQTNRAFEVLRKKFLCAGGRAAVGINYEGLGLIRLPQKAKSPGEPTEALTPTGHPRSTCS